MKKLFLIPALVLLLMMMGMIGFFAWLAYGERYPSTLDSSVAVPSFTEVALPHHHEFSESSLPFMGAAVIDVDNDGKPELYLGGAGHQKDKLYRFTDDHFEESEASRGLKKPAGDASFGVAVADMDNNGFADLIVARESDVWLYLNDGGRFTGSRLQVPLNDRSTALSVALGDVDKDGYIDIFVATYIKKDLVEGQNIFNKQGYGSTSLLLINRGDGSFEDTTIAAGLEYVHNTFQAAFIDLDDDTNLDLVVVHDTGHVKTWRNLGNGRFADVPNPTSAVYGYPMGLAIGDFNNDGRIDLAFSNVGNMGPMTFMVKGDLTDGQTYNEKHVLLRNDGDFKFTRVENDAHIADYEFGWGLIFQEFNLDGRQDLVMAQNYVKLPPHKLFRSPSRFLLHGQDGRYSAVEQFTGTTNRKFPIAPLSADFNGDGHPDLVFANLNSQSRAFISTGDTGNNFLKVQLAPIANNLGAKVELVLADGSTRADVYVPGEGLCSDQSFELIFGLGKNESITRMSVTRLTGGVQPVDPPSVNSTVKVQGI